MATLKFKFTTKGQGNFKNKLTLQCSVKGTSVRHYLLVDCYMKPFDLNYWNEDKGKFYDGENVVFNNSALSEILTECTDLSQRKSFPTGKELFEQYRSFRISKIVPIPTFIEWLDSHIEAEKGKDSGKSTNFQLYKTLKHKLKGIDIKKNKTFEAPRCNGRLIGEYLITEIDTVCFRDFCNWILNEHKGLGYRNLCTSFIASIAKMKEYNTTRFLDNCKKKALSLQC